MGDSLPRNRFFTEHVVFILLLLPTIIVLVAAVLSLAHVDPSIAVQAASAQKTAACEACREAYPDDADGP